jgi:hypothetical protein
VQLLYPQVEFDRVVSCLTDVLDINDWDRFETEEGLVNASPGTWHPGDVAASR